MRVNVKVYHIHAERQATDRPVCRIYTNMYMAFVSLLVIASGVHGQDLITLCNTKTDGTSAKIICQFSEDLSQTDKVSAVFVQRYTFNTSDRRAVDVVDCYLHNGACWNLPPSNGYKFSDRITNTFTITIDKLKPEYEGRYLCYVQGRTTDIGAQKNFCNLKRGTSACFLEVTEGHPARLTFPFDYRTLSGNPDILITRTRTDVGHEDDLGSCHWFTSGLRCNTPPDISIVSQEQADNFTISIPVASSSMSGKYFVTVTHSILGFSSSCDLSVRDAQGDKKPGATQTIPTIRSDYVQKDYSDHAVLQTIAVFLGIIAFAVLLFLLLLIYWFCTREARSVFTFGRDKRQSRPKLPEERSALMDIRVEQAARQLVHVFVTAAESALQDRLSRRTMTSELSLPRAGGPGPSGADDNTNVSEDFNVIRFRDISEGTDD